MDRLKLATLALFVSGLGFAVTGLALWLSNGSSTRGEPHAIPEGAELLAAGEKIVRERNCNFCHRTERPASHPAARDNCQQCHQYENRPEFLAPPLDRIAERRPESWLRRYLRYPYKLREHSPDVMPDLQLSDREVEILTRYMSVRAGDVIAGLPGTVVQRESSPSAAMLAQGKSLFERFTCGSCHSLTSKAELVRKADGSLTNPSARFAPDLGKAWTRLRPAWVVAAISEPEKWLPWSGMPKQNMTAGEAQTLAWYVLNAVPSPGPSVDYQRVLAILSARCNGCHYGPQENAQFATNPEGGAGWLATWGQHPRKLDLMSLQGLMRGAVDDLGRPRPTVVPYAENSPLLMHLKGLKPPVMPFGNDPLPADEIAAIEKWILSGAPMPDDKGDIKVAPPIEMGKGD